MSTVKKVAKNRTGFQKSGKDKDPKKKQSAKKLKTEKKPSPGKMAKAVHKRKAATQSRGFFFTYYSYLWPDSRHYLFLKTGDCIIVAKHHS